MEYVIIAVDTLTRSISVVIPAYNEEKRLASTLKQVLEYLSRGNWLFAEVLVVDDGSRDSTAALAERFEKTDSRIRLLRNPGNRGKGYSVRHGMLEARGDWVLFTDADLSSPIEELSRLISAAESRKASVAIGSRALDRSLIGVHQSAFRENAGRFFNLCVRLIAGLPFSDTQCGFKLFERQAAQEIFSRQRLERFGFDPEILFIARQRGYRTAEVAVRWNNAEGTKVTLLGGLTPFIDLFRIRWNHLLGRYA